MLGLGAGATGTATAHEQSDDGRNGDGQQDGHGQLLIEVEVKQDADRQVYGAFPGQRRLCERAFATPEKPESPVEPNPVDSPVSHGQTNVFSQSKTQL